MVGGFPRRRIVSWAFSAPAFPAFLSAIVSPFLVDLYVFESKFQTHPKFLFRFVALPALALFHLVNTGRLFGTD
jgi:hypothetical protein